MKLFVAMLYVFLKENGTKLCDFSRAAMKDNTLWTGRVKVLSFMLTALSVICGHRWE